MQDYFHGIDEDLWRSIESGPYRETWVQAVGNARAVEDMIAQVNKKKANDKKCLHELRGDLPRVVYNYVHRCKDAKEIWDTLKGKYQGNERMKKSSVTKCLNMQISSKRKTKISRCTTTRLMIWSSSAINMELFIQLWNSTSLSYVESEKNGATSVWWSRRRSILIHIRYRIYTIF